VRELWDLQARHPELKDVPLRPQKGDVEIILGEPQDDGYATLIVSDRGVGMTEEVIRDYFLVAGASYRQSEAWKRQYEGDLEASQGSDLRSRVLRSGRFGIGVLAAFLLGDEILVETRHVHALRGLRFSARLASSLLELDYDLNIPHGTIISVRISRQTYQGLRDNSSVKYLMAATESEGLANARANDLSWDWYTLGSPKVLRRAGVDLQEVEQRYNYPLPLLPLPPGWRRTEVKGYLDVQWIHSYNRGPQLVCNGLVVIDKRKSLYRDQSHGWPWWLDYPDLSVFDPDGNLPLNLMRDSISSTLPFQEELLRSVLRNHFANILINIRESPLESLFRVGRITPYSKSNSAVEFHAVNQEGLTFASRLLINKVAPASALLIDPKKLKLINHIDLRESICLSMSMLPSYNLFVKQGDTYAGRDLLEALGNRGRSLLGRTIVGLRIGASQALVRGALKNTLHDEFERVLQIAEAGNSGVVELGDCRQTGLSEQLMKVAGLSKSIYLQFIEVFWETKSEPAWDDPVSQCWMEVFGQPLIPFDPDERRTQLARAYEILDPYIKLHEGEAKMAKAEEQVKEEGLDPRTSS
jgi:hypothetical protein